MDDSLDPHDSLGVCLRVVDGVENAVKLKYIRINGDSIWARANWTSILAPSY